MGEVISPIMAAKKGFGLPLPAIGPAGGRRPVAGRRGGPGRARCRPAPAPSARCCTGQFAGCQFTTGLRRELGLAAIALAAAGTPGPDAKLSEQALSQLIKYVVMHEVGHSLGLRHNFHASTMLTADEINDPAITRVKGQSGSVMDYNPLNIAPKGKKQGDFTTTTIGPYDYWAIEYAYKPIEGDEEAELRKIAARSPDPDLVYSTDEDMFLDNDPLVNAFDLGSDPTRYARDRVALAAELMKGLDEKVVKEGEPWSRTRRRLLHPALPVGGRRVPGLVADRRPVRLPRPPGQEKPKDKDKDKDKEHKDKTRMRARRPRTTKDAKAEAPSRPAARPDRPGPGHASSARP